MWFESDLLNILVVLAPVLLLMWFDGGDSPRDKSKEKISESKLALKTPMTSTHKIPKGLRKCGECGEYKGQMIEKDEELITISCLCEGILCTKCRKNKVHRPISNYYDKESNSIWHVPYFVAQFGCAECRKNNDNE